MSITSHVLRLRMGSLRSMVRAPPITMRRLMARSPKTLPKSMSRKLGEQDVLIHNPSTEHAKNSVIDEDEDMDLTGSPSKHDANDLDKDEDMDFIGQPTVPHP